MCFFLSFFCCCELASFFIESLLSAWVGSGFVFFLFIFRFLFVKTFSWGGLGWPLPPDGAIRAYIRVACSVLTYSFTKIFHSDYAPCIMPHIKDAACIRVTYSLFSHRCSSSSIYQSKVYDTGGRVTYPFTPTATAQLHHLQLQLHTLIMLLTYSSYFKG